MTPETETNKLNVDEVLGERIKNKVLKEIEKRLNSKNVTFRLENGSHIEGQHFLGKIYRIVYEDRENDENKSSMIMKIAPSNTDCRDRLQMNGIFSQEIHMYDKILSYFREFQLAKGINLSENGFNEYPDYYFSVNEEFSECLFIEDLCRRNFEMINQRKESITFDHMCLLMKALGKFHAISFALKDQQPEKFSELTNLITERYWTIWTAPKSETESFFLGMLNRLTNVLREDNRLDLLEKFDKIVGDDIATTIFQLVSGAAAEPYAVICHGDVTINNTMYSKDENGRPINIQLFDWQLSRYASPVIDLVLYLFCSFTKEQRDKHYTDLLKIYHQSLSDLLLRLGSDPQKLFPFEALLDQLQTFGIYGAIVAAFLIPILYADPDSMPSDKNRGDKERIFIIPNEIKGKYNAEIIGMFDDMAELGYF